jgi:hypothetical protein
MNSLPVFLYRRLSWLVARRPEMMRTISSPSMSFPIGVCDRDQRHAIDRADGLPMFLAVLDAVEPVEGEGISKDPDGSLEARTMLLPVDPVLVRIPSSKHAEPRVATNMALHRYDQDRNPRSDRPPRPHPIPQQRDIGVAKSGMPGQTFPPTRAVLAPFGDS